MEQQDGTAVRASPTSGTARLQRARAACTPSWRCTEGSGVGVVRCGVCGEARGWLNRAGAAYHGRSAWTTSMAPPAGDFPIPRRRVQAAQGRGVWGVRERARSSCGDGCVSGCSGWGEFGRRRPFSPRRATGDSGRVGARETLECPKRLQRQRAWTNASKGGPGGSGSGDDDQGDTATVTGS